MCRSPPTKEATTSLWAGPSAHGRGIKADVRRRRPWYVSDWTDGWNAMAPIDKTPSTADLLEEGTPPSSPAPVVVSSPVVRNRAGSA